jgi:hypothetical protein
MAKKVVSLMLSEAVLEKYKGFLDFSERLTNVRDIMGTSWGHLREIIGTSPGHLWEIPGRSTEHLRDVMGTSSGGLRDTEVPGIGCRFS